MLNFIATDLQLYNIFKIMRVSFLAHSVDILFNANKLSSFTVVIDFMTVT